MKSYSESYKQAGVDITAGYKAVQLMKSHVKRTSTAGVCSDVGGFGGLFEPDLCGISVPVLVSGTDGVGTKLKYAFLLDKHDTVGIDCVAMCVNDIVCCGAKPLIFLDYIACGKLVPERIHSNGFSLVRKVIKPDYDALIRPLESLGGKSIGETLLTPTRIYVKPMLKLFESVTVKGVSHITGGGFYENIPRSIPEGLHAVIDRASLKIPPIFELIKTAGGIPERDMFNTFNMGVGMVAVVAESDAEKALGTLAAAGEEPYVVGEIAEGDEGVVFR